MNYARVRRQVTEAKVRQQHEKIEKLKAVINEIENCAVCASIADPMELLENILKIIEKNKSDK